MLDFEDDSLTQPAMLVTIVTEVALQASLEKLLKNLKVYGYSISAGPGAVRRLQQFGQLRPEVPAAAEVPTAEVAMSEATMSEATISEATISEATTAEAELESYRVASLEIRAVMSPELSNVVLFALKEQRRQFSVLVYRQKVEALLE